MPLSGPMHRRRNLSSWRGNLQKIQLHEYRSMRCYRHREDRAIGICGHCGRAVCPACCDDSGARVACGAECRAQLLRDYRIRERLWEELEIRRARAPASIFVYALFGLILLAVGIHASLTRPGLDYLTLAVSAVFFVMSWGAWKRYRDGCTSCSL